MKAAQRTFTTLDRYAGIVALLMAEPRTLLELRHDLGVLRTKLTTREGISHYLKALRLKGVVYIKDWRAHPVNGKQIAVYALQPSVGYFSDAVAPRRITKPGRPAMPRQQAEAMAA